MVLKSLFIEPVIKSLYHFLIYTFVLFSADIPGQFIKLGATEYSLANWRLFIDSSSISLKCVLLNIPNICGSIPIGHSTTLTEKYDAIKSALQPGAKLAYFLWGCQRFLSCRSGFCPAKNSSTI